MLTETEETRRESSEDSGSFVSTQHAVFMNGLKKAGIELDRKVLSDIAVTDAAGFTSLVEKAKAAL